MKRTHDPRSAKLDSAHLRDLEVGAREAGTILGGIETVPLPERTASTVAIGTWPTPEKPARPLGSLRPGLRR